MKILILNTAFLGDVILTTPLVRRTYELFPGAEIHFLLIPGVKNLLESNPFIKKIIVYDKNNTQKNIFSIFKVGNELKTEKYDLAIVPHRSFRSALLVWRSGVPRRIGFTTSAGWFLYTDRIVYKRDGRHEIERLLDLLSPFGYQREETFPEIYPDDQDVKMVDQILSGDSTKPLIGIAPGSVWGTKRWIPERFAEVCRRLGDKGRVYLIGGKEDFPLCDKISQMAGGNILNFAGSLTIRQSAELIRRSKVILSNDTAPLHMAVAMRTPVVAIFGATVPEFGFSPYGNRNHVIETSGLKCRPCSIHGGNTCPIRTFDCMNQISVSTVLPRLTEYLS